jgi:hypothetical protein
MATASAMRSRVAIRQPAALWPGKGKIESVRNAPLEDDKMIGERQHRLHHMQIMQARRVGFRERCRQEIGLLLVVTFDHDPVAGLDDRLEQLGRPLRGAEFSACDAHRSGSRQPRGAIRFAP